MIDIFFVFLNIFKKALEVLTAEKRFKSKFSLHNLSVDLTKLDLLTASPTLLTNMFNVFFFFFIILITVLMDFSLNVEFLIPIILPPDKKFRELRLE